MLPGFSQNSNNTLPPRSRFCSADPDNRLERGAWTNELSPWCSNKEPIYRTSIKIKPISSANWTKAIRTIASRADLVTKLLMNEMPDTIENAFLES